ncbi:MAG TPA: hypothetical protein VH186_36085 [Chloroflexia bacterium]|nr:hypothetical protein [Chloroflexia bacterium]
MPLLKKVPFASKLTGSGGLGEYYHFGRREEEAFEGFTSRQISKMVDSRQLYLGPQRIGDGIAVRQDGRLSAVLKVSSINLVMATREEQAGVLGSFHGLLRQLPDCQAQFKLRIEEASFAKAVERLDWSIGHITSPLLGKMARQHRQYLKDLERQGFMEFNQYVIVSTFNPRLARMEQIFEASTGRQSFLGTDPGYSASTRVSASKEPNPVNPNSEGTSGSTNFWRKLFSSKSGKARATERLRQQKWQARRAAEMEQELYEEFQRDARNLENAVSIVADGLAMTGLNVKRLPDWELIALYARYLRPELSERTLLSGKPDNFALSPNSFLQESRPVSFAEFSGKLNSTVLSSELPEEQNYRDRLESAGRLLQFKAARRASPNSGSKGTLASPASEAHPGEPRLGKPSPGQPAVERGKPERR